MPTINTLAVMEFAIMEFAIMEFDSEVLFMRL